MSRKARIEQLLEEVLCSGLTPEQVCAGAPELLAEVRRRFDQVKEIESQLRQLFPPSDQIISRVDLGAQVGLRRMLVRQDQAEEAIEFWQESMDQHPDDHEAWDGYAEYCLFVGRTDDYLNGRSRLLARFGDSQDPGVCERTGRACLLLPLESDDDLRRATTAIDRAVAAARKPPRPLPRLPYYRFAKGLAEYRAGKHEAAVAILTGDAATVLQPAPQLVTAMARHRLGQPGAARDVLARAIASFDWTPERARDDDQREVWIYHILRREAESLTSPGR